MTVVCIAGMHRSGTSMIARALNLSGLYLGREEDITFIGEDNRDGFWENVHLVDLNNKILAHHQGAWDVPPSLPPGWEKRAEMLPYYIRAAHITEKFRNQEFWGWKDPRSSLTIDFWKSALPNLKVVICVRNPLEVAHSLEKRGYASHEFSFNLWQIYNDRIFSAIPPEDKIVTHFDAYFNNPRKELERVLRFLELYPSDEQLEAALRSVKTRSRHNNATLWDLLEHSPSYELIDLYQRLCQSAGPVYEVATGGNLVLPNFSREEYDKYKTSKERILEARIAEKEAQIAEKEAQIAEKDARIAEKEQERQVLVARIMEKEQNIQALMAELQEIKSGVKWGIFQRLIRFRLAVFPPGSRRERAAHLFIKGWRILRAEGAGGLFRRAFRRLRLSFVRRRIKVPHPSPRESFMTNAVDVYVPLDYEKIHADPLPAKVLAFYLPQFHPIPENDEWWGKGFTEWTNVSKANPNFIGHYQPHLPGELGFYDLRILDVQRRQVELAKQYGIYGFCFYYYWFAGKRLLELPLDQYIANPDLDLPFCLCWANENWTRRWDGAEHEMLIEQVHTEDEYKHFIRDIAPYFEDPRYIRVNGKPLLVVYRVNLLSNPQKAAEIWRAECRKMGLAEIYLVAAQSFDVSDPRQFGFDAAVQFPPHGAGDSIISQASVKMINPKFKGYIYDYCSAARIMLEKKPGDYTLFKTVMVSWDNTARKQNDSNIFVNSSPSAYQEWLEGALKYTREQLPPDRQFVFINAWNEWAEGTHLEPDRKYGYAYLRATALALRAMNK